jgi:hypothetical protein
MTRRAVISVSDEFYVDDRMRTPFRDRAVAVRVVIKGARDAYSYAFARVCVHWWGGVRVSPVTTAKRP